MSLTKESLIDYITQHCNVTKEDLDDGQLLFSSGLLDSFNMLDIIAFIEGQTPITVGPMDVNLDNLDSVDRIIDFVRRRTTHDPHTTETDSR